MHQNQKVESITLASLSEAEKKVIWLMRELQPFQIIEIKLVANSPHRISVYRKENLREDFPC